MLLDLSKKVKGRKRVPVERAEDEPPLSLIKTLGRQKYHFVGKHSAVKRCRWLHESLVHNRPCYKQKFYGIRTHQCVQMTPSLYQCTQQCLFCWRIQSSDTQEKWNETQFTNWDLPEEIVDGAIREQLRILSGYKDNLKVDRRKLKEAANPSHVAISLAGEPTLYEHIGELIQTFRRRGFTTFLVSNGSRPSKLANLDVEPTQLYISVCASDKETFNAVCRPHSADTWLKLNETLSLLPSLKCPTVIRITLANELNMRNVDGYAELVRRAEPTYVEPKAYMHVGFSRLRIGYEATPSHSQVKEFARQLSLKTGYEILDESTESKVVLMSKLHTTIKLNSQI